MNFRSSILLSIFAHIAVFVFFFTNNIPSNAGANQRMELMDITLETSPSNKNKAVYRTRPALNKDLITLKQNENKPAEHMFVEDYSGKGTDNIKYTEKGGHGELEDYYSSVRTKIIKNMRYPKISRANNEEGSVRIAFSIDKRGRLIDLSILEECGFESLNNDAVKTISTAAPFNSFPASIRKESLSLNIPLKYELH